MKRNRRAACGLFAAAAAWLVVWDAQAQAGNYPARPVEIVTQTPAGAGPDVIARIVAEGLSQIWRQQVVVINRPGAGGLIAARAAAHTNPDGYSLYMPISSTFIVLPEAQPTAPVDPQRDMVPIGLIGEQPMVIAVNPSVGVKSISELVALSKKQPGEILFGASVGSLPHLTGEALQARTGSAMRFIPYSNTTKAMQDASAGTISVFVESLSGLAGPMHAGTLKALAVASVSRLPDFPNLPTVSESMPGLGTFEARGWFVLAAPAHTPDAIVQKIGHDLRLVLNDPKVQQRFKALGTYAHPLSSADTVAFIRKEQALWRPIVRQVGMAKR